MTISFPASLDSLSNPAASDPRTGHAAQHALVNDAIEALQAKMGIDGSVVATTVDHIISLPGHLDVHKQLGLGSYSVDPWDTGGMSIVSFITGSDNESYAVTNCTKSTDTTNYTVGDRAVNMSMSGAVTATLFRVFSGGKPFGAAQVIGIDIYIPDASKITSVGVYVYQDAALTILWSRAQTTGLVNGWNYIRFSAAAGTITGWGTAYRVYAVIATNAATNVTVGHIYGERRPKASILFINDGPYIRFMEDQYPDLKARNIPVTLAVDPGLLGTSSGQTQRATEAEVLAFANDGNGNEISFHGYDGSATSGMTAAQIRADTRNAQDWLIERGYIWGALWRAAYVQNLATNASAAIPYLMAQASSTSNGSYTAWPPITPNDIGRTIIAEAWTNGEIDIVFDTLKKTHCAHIHYIHSVGAGDPINRALPETWAYWLSKIDTGIAEGWLEFVTFQTLFRRAGGVIENRGGRLIAKWSLPDGTVKSIKLG